MPIVGTDSMGVAAAGLPDSAERLRAAGLSIAARRIQPGVSTVSGTLPEPVPAGPDRTSLPARNPQQESAPDGRPTAPFLAQLIGQEREPGSLAAAEQLQFRRQLAVTNSDDGAAQARRRRGSAEQRAETPQQSVNAYQRVAASSLAYASARYGVVRGVEGLFVFNPNVLDISV